MKGSLEVRCSFQREFSRGYLILSSAIVQNRILSGQILYTEVSSHGIIMHFSQNIFNFRLRNNDLNNMKFYTWILLFPEEDVSSNKLFNYAKYIFSDDLFAKISYQLGHFPLSFALRITLIADRSNS